jgi:hypothetical protein
MRLLVYLRIKKGCFAWQLQCTPSKLLHAAGNKKNSFSGTAFVITEIHSGKNTRQIAFIFSRITVKCTAEAVCTVYKVVHAKSVLKCIIFEGLQMTKFLSR